MLSRNKSRLMYGAVRSLSTSPHVNANHYDVLEITPKANQRDIKSAYYKLSKIYHPDKSSDEASAKKFRAITEAYEVLGNVQLKKMYDKGLIVGRENKSRVDYKPESEPTDPTLRFYKSRERMHIVPTMDGRTPIYDFDAWSRNHYGDLFHKSQHDKEFNKKIREIQIDKTNANKQETVMFALFVLGSLFMLLVIKGKEDYDKINTAKQTTIENNTK